MMTTMMRNWCIGGPPSAIKKLQCFLQHKARTSTFTRVTISIGNTASLRQSMENSRCFNTIRCSVSKSESETSSSTAVQSKGHKTKAKFCQSCGGPTKKCIPEGEEKMRAVCTLCGDVYYENPKMGDGCIENGESEPCFLENCEVVGRWPWRGHVDQPSYIYKLCDLPNVAVA